MTFIVPTLRDYQLSDIDVPTHSVNKQLAETVFNYFAQQKIFGWKNTHNGCEGRADALCVLLDEWKVPNYKAWVFSGAYLKKHVGALKQNWKYHVAAAIPVEESGKTVYYVIDSATAPALQQIETWAADLTLFPHSYYFIRLANWYIFPHKKILTSKWNSRNKQNRKWMIQCLAGINGLTPSGKARLCFNKSHLKKTALVFEKMKKEKPLFLIG